MFLGLVAIYYLFRFDYWERDIIIRSDGYAYYGYVQGTLVHHDPLNTFHGELEGKDRNRSWMHEGLPGKYLPKMTMAIAYAWTPGFFLADLAASLLDYPQDGWSRPYQLAVGFSAVLFLLIGLWATWHVLRRRFSDTISSAVVMVIYLVTNLLQYGSVDASMSHVYSFALIACFMLVSDRWVERRSLSHLLAAAFLLGWIVLIRPTNIIVGLYLPFMLWQRDGNIRSLLSWQILYAAGAAFLPILPQLIFWKLAAGEWVHYSYEQEAFYWMSPHIWEGLFSYRNGWLVYTPVMWLALLGLAFYSRIEKRLALGLGVVTLLHIYITFSWWCWYYGGSLSIRPMIDIYPILALGMAAMFSFIWRRGMVPTLIAAVVVLSLGWNNILQVKYSNLGVIHDSAMTKEAFWATFMTPKQPGHLSMAGYYRDPDTDHLRLGLPERLEYDTAYSQMVGKIEYQRIGMDQVRRFTNMLKVNASELPLNVDSLIQITCEVKMNDVDANELIAIVAFKKGEETYQYQGADLGKILNDAGVRKTVKLFVRKPRNLPEGTHMECYYWLKGKGSAEAYSMEITPIKVTRRPL